MAPAPRVSVKARAWHREDQQAGRPACLDRCRETAGSAPELLRIPSGRPAGLVPFLLPQKSQYHWDLGLLTKEGLDLTLHIETGNQAEAGTFPRPHGQFSGLTRTARCPNSQRKPPRPGVSHQALDG